MHVAFLLESTYLHYGMCLCRLEAIKRLAIFYIIWSLVMTERTFRVLDKKTKKKKRELLMRPNLPKLAILGLET